MPGSDAALLLTPLAAIAREAGKIALAASKRPLRRWHKAGDSPVSEADIAVNDFLAARLPPLVADAAWLSEETADNAARGAARTVWVVDPIDGTRAFLDGRSDWSISIALVADGRPVAAALHAPAMEEMFLAAAGHGATLNGVALAADPGDTLDGARIAGPQGYLRRIVAAQPRLLAQPKIHSLALRLARVAQGTLDVAIASRHSHDWDLAAADLLVHEAGGVMTDIGGNPVIYNRPDPIHDMLVAAGMARYPVVASLVREHRNAFR